jgi:uncharacterized membrane protein
MAYYLKLYMITLAAFLCIDMIWLGLVARTLYRNYLGFLMAPKVNWLAAIIFYLLFVLGLLIFVILPGVKENALGATLLRAALFGLITYATYDLTNLATLKDWPVFITVVDMTWGTVLSVAVCYIGFLAGKWLG